MKILLRVCNFFGVLISIVLSLVLVLLLVVSTVVYAVSSAVTADTIQDFATGYFEAQLSQAVEDGMENGDGDSMPPEIILNLMETEAMKEAIGIYVETLFGELNGEESKLTMDSLRSIVNDHMDEITPLAEKLLQEQGLSEIAPSDEELQQMVSAMVEAYGPMLIEELPTLEDLGLDEIVAQEDSAAVILERITIDKIIEGDLTKEEILLLAAEVLKGLHSGFFIKGICAAVAMVCLMILLCRIGGFRGFAWLSVDFLLAVMLNIAVCFYAWTYLMQVKTAGFDVPIILIADIMLNKLMIGIGVEAVIMILFGFITVTGEALLAKRRAKKRAALQPQAE